jgi:DNA-binding response OmpR family regulator
MERSERSEGNAPQTRHTRFKTILLVCPDEAWGSPIQNALSMGGYRVHSTSDVHDSLRAIRDGRNDLGVLSDLVGDRALEAILEEVKALRLPPPMLLVASLHGEKRWEAWRAVPRRSLVKAPFQVSDIVEATRALIGSPWEDLSAPA